VNQGKRDSAQNVVDAADKVMKRVDEHKPHEMTVFFIT
jgi:hypothetical protein